jgi:hypothetical protein
MKKQSKMRLITLIGSIAFAMCLTASITFYFSRNLPQSAMAQGSSPGDPLPSGLGTDIFLGSNQDSVGAYSPMPGEPHSSSLQAGAPIPILTPNACDAPIVLHGSIITGTNPQFTGRLIRNGVPSLCGQPFSCSGAQSTSTPFSYEKFDFINSSSAWQCVHVDFNAKSCTQQVYSAVYTNTFNSGNLCTNVAGAMGYSTSGEYGYSFSAPPNTNFSIVNNTTGILPPSSNCADYTMTVTLCSSNLNMAVSQGSGLPVLQADASGNLTAPVPVTFKNNSDSTAKVDTSTVSQTVKISVLDGKPAAVQAKFGEAGAIVLPGDTITQTVPLQFSGSQSTCLPRTFEVTSQLSMTEGIYECNGYNPPSADVVAGAISPDTTFGGDTFAFRSQAGVHITATVDTVSAATAFNAKACISDTRDGGCLPGLSGDDDFNCTFAPTGQMCPRFGGLLPPDSDGDNIYYLQINSASGAGQFAGLTGNYRGSLLITSGPTGACPAVQTLNDGTNQVNATQAPTQLLASQVPTRTITANVLPITVRVPPADPNNPSCGYSYVPLLKR